MQEVESYCLVEKIILQEEEDDGLDCKIFLKESGSGKMKLNW